MINMVLYIGNSLKLIIYFDITQKNVLFKIKKGTTLPTVCASQLQSQAEVMDTS